MLNDPDLNFAAFLSTNGSSAAAGPPILGLRFDDSRNHGTFFPRGRR